MKNTAMLQRTLELAFGELTLTGELTVPHEAVGLVIIARDGARRRQSARDRFVAGALQKRRLATLAVDLLTPAEEVRDALDAHLRLDIRLLADRLEEVTAWVQSYSPLTGLQIGYFGSDTTAAAALLASIERRGSVRAVVTRGGRPDLVHDMLIRISVPALLIVGGRDTQVLEVNEEALAHLPSTTQLAVVPGATHSFEEPGALERVAALAGDWLVRHLGAGVAS